MTRRIVVNGRFLGRPTTGVERFARETVRAMDQLCAEHHPILDGIRMVVAVPSGLGPLPSFGSIAVERTGFMTGHAWEQIELPLFAGRDTIINLCNTGPVLKHRAVTCVHDAHVWLVPENFSRAFRLAYKALIPALLRTNRRWTTVSRFSEMSLRSFGVAPGPANAISSNGSGHVAAWDAARSVLQTSELPDRFVFALASRSPLKNTGLIFALAERLRPLGVAVVVAGTTNRRVFDDASLSRPAGSNVVELGRITDDDIALMMSRAQCFVFPSFHEGFGLPPIEAMALGCPVVASNTSALPEVLDDAALLCAPGDVGAWVEAVLALGRDEDLRSGQIARGRERAARFAWPRTAVTMLEQAVAT